MDLVESAARDLSSTSLWGRELKSLLPHTVSKRLCRPPCEVVNWNRYEQKAKRFSSGRPPCEVVNWNAFGAIKPGDEICRPPCEVVNWNKEICYAYISFWRSTSLWGRELKYSVRWPRTPRILSTSLWGRELKCFTAFRMGVLMESTSLWGRELKCYCLVRSVSHLNVDLLVRSWIEMLFPDIRTDYTDVDLLVRSWIEILFGKDRIKEVISRPPCEVVNWNMLVTKQNTHSLGRPPCEVVNWNYNRDEVIIFFTVDLLVRSWIEIQMQT